MTTGNLKRCFHIFIYPCYHLNGPLPESVSFIANIWLSPDTTSTETLQSTWPIKMYCTPCVSKGQNDTEYVHVQLANALQHWRRSYVRGQLKCWLLGEIYREARDIYTYNWTNCTNKLRNACTRVNNYMFITTLHIRWS